MVLTQMQQVKTLKLRFEKGDAATLRSHTAYMRKLKQVDLDLLVLEFADDLKVEKIEQKPRDLLEWSKLGQRFCRFIEASPFQTLAVLGARASKFELEIALACDFIDFNNSKWTAKTLENPCFGTSRRLNGISLGAALKNKLKSRQQLFAELERRQRFARRLEKHAVAKHPLEVDKQDYVEAAVFAGQTYSEVFATKIAFGSDEGAPAEKLTEQNMLDDLGNDYMDFSTYPDDEIRVLARKQRIREVELLLEQDHAKISGRCVELGSGYGYFSAIASKSARVSEIVGLDISTAEIYYLGPYMWDVLEPDWSKLSFVIGDMNEMSTKLGSFDTVIFCASLHHSGNIPRSLEQAAKLLRPGGSLIIHGEHYDPVFLGPKSRKGSTNLHTIPQFSKALKKVGLKPKVFRYVLPGGRRPALKRLLFTVWPFCLVNGWVRFSSYMMVAVKPH